MKMFYLTKVAKVVYLKRIEANDEKEALKLAEDMDWEVDDQETENEWIEEA